MNAACRGGAVCRQAGWGRAVALGVALAFAGVAAACGGHASGAPDAAGDAAGAADGGVADGGVADGGVADGGVADGGVGPLGPLTVVNTAAWPLHTIDARFRGANALGRGDLDGDGWTDYVTNYEFDQRIVVALHPGAGGDVRRPWPTVMVRAPAAADAAEGINPENAALGDLDGDGALDVVSAHGWSTIPWWEGSAPGLRVFWGPPTADVRAGSAWTDAGRFPASVDRGHFHFVAVADVNGDGATDVLAGGRVQENTGRRAGLVWVEAPREAARRRDLDAWTFHDIDPEQTGGHGFVQADLDGDGDADLVLANADFDTPEADEAVLWYENPGPGAAAQKGPWPKHEIGRGDDFHTKAQVAVADLDEDGRDDVVSQLPDAFLWYRRTGAGADAWERIRIEKPPAARLLARTTAVADLDRDGRPDLVGALVHEGGTLPADKAAVFWLQQTGDPATAEGWTLRVVKWGSGPTMLIPEFGEKWDQVHVTDVDGDGDLDLVANCEEWWQDGGLPFPFWDERVGPALVAVAWFENRIGEPPFACAEQAGRCVLEAEHAADRRDDSWLPRGVGDGFVGTGYLQDHRVLDVGPATWADTRGAEWRLELAGGRYAVWLRRRVPDAWGVTGAAPERPGLWVALDEAVPAEPFVEDPAPGDQWGWVRAAEDVALAAGTHTLTLRVHTPGYAVDRLAVTADPAWAPEGEGPPETPAP